MDRNDRQGGAEKRPGVGLGKTRCVGQQRRGGEMCVWRGWEVCSSERVGRRGETSQRCWLLLLVPTQEATAALVVSKWPGSDRGYSDSDLLAV